MFTSAATAQFVVGTAGSFTVASRSYPAATITASGTLPTGLTVTDHGDGTATLSGTPGAGTGGTYVLTFTAANGLAPNATQTVTVTVLQQAPTATAAVLAGTVNANATYGSYHFTVPVAGAEVHLFPVGSDTEVGTATTGTNGSYELDGVAPGSYQVQVVDPKGAYATRWYAGTAAGAADRTGAATVTLTAGSATTGTGVTLDHV